MSSTLGASNAPLLHEAVDVGSSLEVNALLFGTKFDHEGQRWYVDIHTDYSASPIVLTETFPPLRKAAAESTAISGRRPYWLMTRSSSASRSRRLSSCGRRPFGPGTG